MRVIAIANMAGSAGKTSSAVTLATLLAEGGLQVLLIDADPQSNASIWLDHEDPEPTIGDVLLHRRDLGETIVATQVDGLRLLPASPNLDPDALALARTLGGEQRLRLALETWAAQIDTPADVVVIDCPGAMSILTVAALVAATSVLTVTQPTIKELSGVPKLEATINEVAQAYRPGLTLDGVLPCIVPPARSGAVYSESMDLLRKSYGDLVSPAVRRSVRVPEAYAQRTPLPIHAPSEAVTADYRAVAEHLAKTGVLPAISGIPR